MRIEGSLDRFDAIKLEGWLIDHDSPATKLQLSVHFGPTLLGTYTADRFRQDLADGGLADGCCSFSIELPPYISETEIGALKVAVIGTPYYFPARVGTPVFGQTPRELYEAMVTELQASGRHWLKFQTCILHIGTEKTGSTSLQRSFGLNRNALEESGYFIPRSLAPQASDATLKHSSLAAISMSDTKIQDDLRRKFHMIAAEGLHKGRRYAFDSFSAEVATAPSICRALIVSDEHCHSRLTSIEEVQNLKDFLDHFCESYSIVVYLRPQHELAISQYGMFVANGVYDIDVLPHFPPLGNSDKQIYTSVNYFDYQKLLERWSQVFGADAVHPRIYGAKELRGGDIVTDFAAHLSLATNLLALPDRLNSDISARAQTFLILFYRSLSARKGPDADLLGERVRNAVRACFPGAGAIPERADVVAFLDQFTETNENVRIQWFPQRKRLFEIDLNKFPERAPSIEMSSKEIMDMFVEILAMDQEMRFSLSADALHRLADLSGVER